MKQKNLISIFVIALFCLPTFSQINVDQLLAENRVNPLGIDNLRPKLTWVLSSGEKSKTQSAYQIQVSNDRTGFNNDLIWDSDKVTSNQSVRIMYQGPEMKSLKKYYWRVRVWDEKGKVSKWSNVAFWQMGILNKTDWKSQWISAGYLEDSLRPSPALRSEFKIQKKIENAYVVITSHGMYQAFLNGEKIGNDYLTPGWTSYNKRLQYQVYDISNMLKQGRNAIGALLGSGWYRSALGWGDNENLYGSELALLMQIQIEYSDGTQEIIGTDKNWKSAKSAIQSSEIYNGETIDARKTLGEWIETGYKDRSWLPVKVQNYGYENLIATYNEPVRKHEIIKPLNIIITPEGDKIIDFGQNLVGFVEVEVQGKKGDSLIIDHAEVLDKEGNFYTENLRAAKQENNYVLNGEGKEHFQPHFTWQGFRYIRIKGNMKDKISLNNFKAVVLYSDMRKTGSFTTSNKLLNQLQHNIQWGQKGNFLDVPTDCPQRDERLGWTGDAQVFFKTAGYNMHVDNFFSKWMKDVAADQKKDGSVPFVIPNVLGENSAGSAGWADVATIIPWDIYLIYGNKDVLKTQYSSMRSWVDYMSSKSTNYLWNTGFHFGDWLFYRPDDDNDGRAAITDKYLIAQCFYAHSVQLLINAAKVLENNKDVEKYTALLQHIKNAFVSEYMTPNGRLVSSSQTAYVLALHFGMMPENLRAQAVERLVENIKSYNYHLTTGFLGTPYLCLVLSRYGYHDLAYTLLMQQTYPSWLYPVTAGATTIWERWDGRKPDGSFQTPGMNSFNHYAYGAIGDWMYRELAGINNSEKMGETGYKKIVLTPHFESKYVSEEVKKQNNGEQLNEVNASLETYYGNIRSHWKRDGNRVIYRVEIPVNTSAEIHFPETQVNKIKENNNEIATSDKNIKIETNSEETILYIGSGGYNFSIDD
ncbi:alpha-L-rhamnosidase [Galbibacter pacificus]|uniref:alpha-L-rhamnosidase n=1 Tax=Galbibacter pacificus TaxID=2996052 RepID=A0ABT6FN44_9FLAO|nr:alpha-L-rhamnosidase [Galbibacter pacificus]MDG3581210.1 family 78 glycoside hydrolase catalytic domain [Galbibacter pacificus]MDG3584688.1 family 78 glycoside hydrolase catalytic domain [Galbibacter pacificus]